MQISSRFTMAIHMFACIDTFSDQKMTSDFMAASIGTNPVIVRKILQQCRLVEHDNFRIKGNCFCNFCHLTL